MRDGAGDGAGHAGHPGRHVLDVDRVELVAAPVDAITDAAEDVVTVVSALDEIPGVEPAVAKLGGGEVRPVQVAFHHPETAHDQLAFSFNHLARPVDQPKFDIRDRPGGPVGDLLINPDRHSCAVVPVSAYALTSFVVPALSRNQSTTILFGDCPMIAYVRAVGTP